MTERGTDQNKELSEVKIFPVPFAIEETKEIISISTNTSTKSSREQLIKQAFKFHSQGNIPEAIKYYQQFIKQGFKDPIVFSNYGLILKGLGKLKEAELLQRKAIELKPNFAHAHYNLGTILIALGDSEAAQVSLRKTIELKKDFAEAYSNLGKLLKDLGKLKEAEIFLRKTIELKPDFAGAYYNLGNILKELNKFQEAEILLRKAIKLKPDFADAYCNLGNILRELGKLQEAEISLLKAIKINPNDKNAKSNLINLLTVHKPENITSSQLYIVNEEFRRIKLITKENELITDEEVIRFYQKAHNILFSCRPRIRRV